MALMDDQTETTVREVLLKAKMNADSGFEYAVTKILNYWDGHQYKDPGSGETYSSDTHYFGKRVMESHPEYKDRSRNFVNLNITEHVVKSLMRNWDEPPGLEIYITDQDDEKQTTIVDDQEVALSDKLTKEVEHAWSQDNYFEDWEMAIQYALLGVGTFDVIQYNKVTKHTESTFWTYDRVRFVQDRLQPEKITSLVTMFSTSETTDLDYDDQIDWVYTDKYKVMFVNEEPHGETFDHDYGVIPAVHIRYKKRWGEVWGVGLGETIAYYNQKINDKLSHIADLAETQSYKQFVFVDTSDLPHGIGARRPIKITSKGERSASVQVMDVNADVMKLVQEVKSYLDAIYALFGMRNQSPTIDLSGGPESGIAKYLEDYEVIRFSKKLGKMIAKYIREDAYMRMRIWGAHNGIKWDDSFREKYIINVKFKDMEPTLGAADKNLRDEFLMSIKVKERANIALEEHPDLLDIETARQHIKDVAIAEALLDDEIARDMAIRRAEIAGGTIGETDKKNELMAELGIAELPEEEETEPNA